MSGIYWKLGTGLISALFLSSSLVHAQDKEKLIRSPVDDRILVPKTTQPPPPTVIQSEPTAATQPPPPTVSQSEPTAATQPPPPTAIQSEPTAATQPPPPTANQTAPTTAGNKPSPPTSHRYSTQESSLPDLLISEYSLSPKPPSRQEVVNVRIGVYNEGGANAGPFTVQWWPGDNYSEPGCTWRVEGLVANGGRILECSGYVYPSWYGEINTGVYVDSGREIPEVSTRNNKLYRKTPVTK